MRRIRLFGAPLRAGLPLLLASVLAVLGITTLAAAASGHTGRDIAPARLHTTSHPGPRAHAAWQGELKNEGSGLCMSSLGTHTDGAAAVQYSCDGSLNQTWYLSSLSIYGDYLVNSGDRWCLTNKGGAESNGNIQTMWPCPGGAVYQELYAFGGGGGIPITFFPRDSSYKNNGYALTSRGVTTSGSHVEEWAADRGASQQWSGPIAEIGCCSNGG
jgi:hypothetical protein